MDGLLLVPIVLPVLAGAALLTSSFLGHVRGTAYPGHARGGDGAEGDSGAGADAAARGVHRYVGAVLAVSVAAALGLAWSGERSVTLFRLVGDIPVMFRVDGVGRFFVTVVSLVWTAATVYAFSYMGHEGEERRYFGFWLVLYGVLVGLDFAGNLVTMYLFYEMVTLSSAPLVLHGGSREAVMAALKYLFYSMCGAYGGLFGIFFLYRYCGTLAFVPGGSLDMAAARGHEGILLAAVSVMLVGFGAKAGMLPLHAWLPAAHPVAPSPASAVLSGVIVKSGVLAMLRAVFYVAGADFLRGTWVQYGWMGLSLVTVFLGSLLAYREKVFKKRLAYSTVSQVSYILFGMSLLTPLGLTGALVHVAVHAFVKCGLFLVAGVFLVCFGQGRADRLAGVGRQAPKLLWCYTLLSLALVGIPPTGGYVGKWYLALGAFASGAGVFAWLGPVVLLTSALLTAGYLLPVAMSGFFPGESAAGATKGQTGQGEPAWGMLLPIVFLTAVSLLTGILPNPLTGYLADIAESLL